MAGGGTTPLVSHMWQEFHKNAPTTIYSGPTNDDKKVVQNPDASGNLQPKQHLHICFHEKGIATIETNVGRATFYAKWVIIDSNGNAIREHPQFSQTNYDANASVARVNSGRKGWLWDGRSNAKIFVPEGSYRSQITLKNAAGDELDPSDAEIRLEGNPYPIFITGQPKTDTELVAEFNRPPFNGRFLTTGGERTSRDCFLLVHRNQETDDGHVVFLSQGTIEADVSGESPCFGAIATPHDRELKGWIRDFNDKPDRIQIQDVGRTTDDHIQLTQTPGIPAPNNPYSNEPCAPPGGPFKNGVQAHGGPVDATNGHWSIGCTTASPIVGATVAVPGTVLRGVRSLDSSFGDWGHHTGEDITMAGPTFVNKQTKRSPKEDALLVDDHSTPLLGPPVQSTSVSSANDEPLHMQPTMQQAVFGGFLGNEVPRSLNVADEPTNKLRIRMTLKGYASSSLYHQYHHVVAFGHSSETIASGHRITVWVPVRIIRGWNANRRNVLVHGHCQISWYVERRLTGGMQGPSELLQALHPIGTAAGTFVSLPGSFLGKAQKDWSHSALTSGIYVSVFRYKVELLPFTSGKDQWEPEQAAPDRFSHQQASISRESIITEGAQQFVEGNNELVIVEVS